MKNIIPEGARAIISRLNAADHEAYLVGGAVRDIVMYGAPLPTSDCDIATSARPEETARVFSDCRVIETGLRHGTLTVLWDGIPYEITTYRSESGYGDCRHPDSVEFVSDLTLDLARRDFTMNAIAASPDGRLVDPFGGADDISRRLIRAVGDPRERFSEDALRILRGLRFASRLGFEIESETARGMLERAHLVEHVSGERVREELVRLLDGEYAESLLISARETLARALPDFSAAPTDAYLAAARAVPRVRRETAPRLAALLSCLPDPAPLIARLALDRRTRTLTELLLRDAPALESAPEGERELLHMMSRIGADAAASLLSYRAAFCDSACTAAAFASASARVTALERAGACHSVAALAVGGADLVALGYPPSPAISRMLSELLSAVIDGRVENTREALLGYIRAER